MAQLKRIQTHRSWLLEPPQAAPRRADFGLPEATTLSRADQQRIDQALAAKRRSADPESGEAESESAAAALQLPAEVQQALAAERRYGEALRHWRSYQTWLKHRNPARAALEARFGYDTKHAMHLVRLLRMGLELLREGELRVRREDAAELLQIRDGAWTLDELLRSVEELRRQMEAAVPHSALPETVDRTAVEELLLGLILPEG